MWIIFCVIACFSISPCITALVCFGENNTDNVPFVFKAPYKYYIAGVALFALIGTVIIGLSKEHDQENKPKYEMIPQGTYYKLERQ